MSFWFCIVSLFAAFCCLQHFVVACVLRVVGSAWFMLPYLHRLAVAARLPLPATVLRDLCMKLIFPNTVQCDDFCADSVQCDDFCTDTVQCDDFCTDTVQCDDFCAHSVQCDDFCTDAVQCESGQCENVCPDSG